LRKVLLASRHGGARRREKIVPTKSNQKHPFEGEERPQKSSSSLKEVKSNFGGRKEIQRKTWATLLKGERRGGKASRKSCLRKGVGKRASALIRGSYWRGGPKFSSRRRERRGARATPDSRVKRIFSQGKRGGGSLTKVTTRLSSGL